MAARSSCLLLCSLLLLAASARLPPEDSLSLATLHAQLDAAEWEGSDVVSAARMLAYANSHSQYVTLWRMNGTRVEHVGGAPENWHSNCFTGSLLPAVAAVLQPTRPIFFLINNYDEPSNRLSTCPPEVTHWHKNVFGWPNRVTDDEAASLPFFSPCKIRGCHRDWLYPFGEVCSSERAISGQPRPWHDRKNQLFWRGSTTGGGDLDTNHRVRAVRLLRNDRRNASHDVAIHEFLQGVPRDSSLEGPRVEMGDWDSYKYILDVGGNSYSRRLSLVAQLRSAVISYNPFEDVFSQTLVNGTHVLFANLEGSNIADLLEMLQSDEVAARRMGARLSAHWETQFNRQVLLDWAVEYVRLYSQTVRVQE